MIILISLLSNTYFSYTNGLVVLIALYIHGLVLEQILLWDCISVFRWIPIFPVDPYLEVLQNFS